ncbi:MAG: hypothetical protein FWC47_17490 [Oscillospiraceae bacterium]|nr:hypothetical protein [Oscillospiraceae bacterium]
MVNNLAELERRIVFVGGHSSLQAKLKKEFDFTFISADVMNFDVTKIKNAKYVLIFTQYMNHPQYNKVMNNLADKKQLRIIKGAHNLKILIRKIYNCIQMNK